MSTILIPVFYGAVGLLAGVGGAVLAQWQQELMNYRASGPHKLGCLVPLLLYSIIGIWLASFFAIDPPRGAVAFMAMSAVGAFVTLEPAGRELSHARRFLRTLRSGHTATIVTRESGESDSPDGPFT